MMEDLPSKKSCSYCNSYGKNYVEMSPTFKRITSSVAHVEMVAMNNRMN